MSRQQQAAVTHLQPMCSCCWGCQDTLHWGLLFLKNWHRFFLFRWALPLRSWKEAWKTFRCGHLYNSVPRTKRITLFFSPLFKKGKEKKGEKKKKEKSWSHSHFKMEKLKQGKSSTLSWLCELKQTSGMNSGCQFIVLGINLLCLRYQICCPNKTKAARTRETRMHTSRD